MKEITLQCNLSPVELSPEQDSKYKVLRGDLIHAGVHHPGNMDHSIYFPPEVLRDAAPSFNLTYSTLDHDHGIMARTGWLDNVNYMDNGQKLVGDFVIPRIPKNQHLIDMIDATYKGKSLIDSVSITCQWDDGDDEEIVNKYGPYATKINGTGVGFVYEGADPDARVTEILNTKKSKMDEKDIEKISELSSAREKIASELERKEDVIVEKEEEIVSMREELDRLRELEKQRDEEALSELRTKVSEKFPKISAMKVNSMPKDALLSLLDVDDDEVETEDEPTKETEPATKEEAEASKGLVYERQKDGKLSFYAETPDYIPAGVAGGEFLRALRGE